MKIRNKNPKYIAYYCQPESILAEEITTRDNGYEIEQLFNGFLIHCDDEPAVVRDDGTEEYWYEGIFYKTKEAWEIRKAYTSYICEKGRNGEYRYWTKKDGLTYDRADGPAIEYKDKSIYEWRINGKLHRDGNKPAICNYAKNIYTYAVDGKYHREDGPAVELPNAPTKSKYFIQDVLKTEGEFYKELHGIRKVDELGATVFYKTGSYVIHNPIGPAIISADKMKEAWYLDGVLHREGGPAEIDKLNNAESWILNGQFHRDGGPAHIDAAGNKYWYKHGNFHNEDGPAVVFSYGDRQWYIDGKLQKQILGGTEFDVYTYDNDGKFHNETGPAIAMASGDYQYLNHGILHRLDGPARFINGNAEYYVEGKQIAENEYMDKYMKFLNVTLTDKDIDTLISEVDPTFTLKDNKTSNLYIRYNAMRIFVRRKLRKLDSNINDLLGMAFENTEGAKSGDSIVATIALLDALVGNKRTEDDFFNLLERGGPFVLRYQDVYHAYVAYAMCSAMGTNGNMIYDIKIKNAIQLAKKWYHEGGPIKNRADFIKELELLENEEYDRLHPVIKAKEPIQNGWKLPFLAIAAAAVAGIAKNMSSATKAKIDSKKTSKRVVEEVQHKC